MKPTYRTIAKISERTSRRGVHRFPNTDYHFQSGAALAGAGATKLAPSLPSVASSNFRKWSTAQVDDVNARDSRVDAVMFVVIIAIAAWPLSALWTTLANYWL